MTDADPTSSKSLRVFLSYSRVDAAFVDELAAGLPLVGNFDITLDRHSIETGVDWKERLEDLIEEADVVVFVLSPDYLSSEVCAWEVEVAGRLHKRLVPVLYRAIGDAPVPAELAAINFVDASAAGTLVGTLKTLGTTLKTDLDWLKQSRRLLNLSRDWDEAGRPDNRLLIAVDIAQATLWLESIPAGVEITDLQREFINASSEAYALRQDQERKRLSEVAEANARAAQAARTGTRWALAGLALSLVLAVAAGWAYLKATEAEQYARLNEELAEQERELANAAKAEAREALREAKLALSKSNFVMLSMVASKGFENTGFDCERAMDLRQPVEFLICANAELAGQDRTMKGYYFDLLEQLPGEQRKPFRDAQVDWIKSRYASCTLDLDRPVTRAQVHEMIACAKTSVQTRIDTLRAHGETFRMFGSLTDPAADKLSDQ